MNVFVPLMSGLACLSSELQNIGVHGSLALEAMQT